MCEISLKCKRELRALTPAPVKGKKSPKKNGFFVLGLPDLEHLLLRVVKKAVCTKKKFTVLCVICSQIGL